MIQGLQNPGFHRPRRLKNNILLLEIISKLLESQALMYKSTQHLSIWNWNNSLQRGLVIPSADICRIVAALNNQTDWVEGRNRNLWVSKSLHYLAKYLCGSQNGQSQTQFDLFTISSSKIPYFSCACSELWSKKKRFTLWNRPKYCFFSAHRRRVLASKMRVSPLEILQTPYFLARLRHNFEPENQRFTLRNHQQMLYFSRAGGAF